MPTIGNLCEATTRSGRHCRAAPLPDSALCFSHNPALAAARTAARSTGGRHKANTFRITKALPLELQDLVTKLTAWLGRVEKGEFSGSQAQALAALTGKLLDLARFAFEIGEHREVEQRLQALEQRMYEGNR